MQEPLFYINSRNFLAFGLNQGNFAAKYYVQTGTSISIRILPMLANTHSTGATVRYRFK